MICTFAERTRGETFPTEGTGSKAILMAGSPWLLSGALQEAGMILSIRMTKDLGLCEDCGG